MSAAASQARVTATGMKAEASTSRYFSVPAFRPCARGQPGLLAGRPPTKRMPGRSRARHG